MEIRGAVEADAERLASMTGAPTDVMRNLIHDRTVRVADDGGVEGFVSYDATDRTVHVTQLVGDQGLCERLLEEPTRFAALEGMNVELLLAEDDDTRAVIEDSEFDEYGPGPQFDGTRTIRYRWDDAE
ncbi:hypothetical protein BRC75_04800 [Halobacteriales archaeon QH_7_69_31]|nr:MAG: hypothetical protein BRC75_04800 [Halobacteriales archaeon QH_7_69_31]